jgi:hypothetical protein
MKIAHDRLLSQQIAASRATNAGDVVSRLGAMQCQDYPGTLWAIGLRLPGATIADIDKAVADRAIVRTWPMRGTLHFVAAKDIRWMLDLLSPRIISGRAARYKELELDEATFARCFRVFEKKMAGGKLLTRDEAFKALEQSRISVDKQRGYHILSRAGQEKVICFGAPRGKQETFTLLDAWIPSSKKLSGEDALAELALRYFSGHGPAALKDFVWWSGLKASDARIGLDLASSQLAHETVDGKVYWMSPTMTKISYDKEAVYLLPGFDEYLLGYKDRSAVLDPKYAQRICPGNNGMFASTIVIDGEVVGAWKRVFKKDKVVITPDFFDGRTKAGGAFFEAAERYAKFMGVSVQK